MDDERFMRVLTAALPDPAKTPLLAAIAFEMRLPW